MKDYPNTLYVKWMQGTTNPDDGFWLTCDFPVDGAAIYRKGELTMKILNRWNNEVILEIEGNLRDANLSNANLSYADLRDANLSYADLSNANLRYADLRNADLRNANLSYADLRYANLSYADLSDANLSNANLRYADLRNANLSYADLSDANLSNANLRYANLSNANLRYADLSNANLEPIKVDFFVVLLHGLPEIEFLKQNIISGKIDGSTYNGECACLSGTLYNGATVHNGIYEADIKNKILACRDAGRPIEVFFAGIRPGDTPENSQFSKIALEWLEEFDSLIARKGTQP
jgi:hypothetical protein